MPSGRRFQRPAAITAPARDSADEWIDVVAQGWVRDRQVRRRNAAMRTGADGHTRPRERGTWLDDANHPTSPDLKGRPPNHYLPLLRKAIQRLVDERRITPAAARRYALDRMLRRLPFSVAVSVFDLPEEISSDLAPELRHRLALAWLVDRFRKITAA